MYDRLDRKMSKKLYDKHSKVFAFLERVLNSCKTQTQLELATKWAVNYLFDLESKEMIGKDLAWQLSIMHYMKFRRDIIREISERKEQEILDFNDNDVVEL